MANGQSERPTPGVPVRIPVLADSAISCPAGTAPNQTSGPGHSHDPPADFPRLWGMRNTGQAVNRVAGTAGIDIDASAAWDLHRGDPAVIVTVIDTGADLDHPDLQANLLPRGGEDWDFADAGDPSPDDEEGHGTHVAGTAAATENAIGVVGVAPRCQIMPLRIDLQAGMNQNRADAINYVAQQAAAHPARR